MARVFVSSTFQDLKEYRQAVYVALRRLGHQSVAMEDYVATDQPPLEKSLDDLRNSDVAVFIIAWRYGYVPAGQQYSMTELELRTAREARIPCLIFLVSDSVPWEKKHIDTDSTNIRRFRDEVLKSYVVAFFTTPEELAMQVAVSLHRWVASGERHAAPAPAEEAATADSPGPEVFLSYAHEDIQVAQSVSERIGREKWSVFWDRTIPVGLTWDDIVEGALDASKCVVVLWSPAARNSDWVKIEAAEGAERGILPPALIEQTKIPLRFRRIQAADLVGWNPGAPDTQGMQALISAIGRCVRGNARGPA